MPSLAVKPRLDRIASTLGVRNDYVYHDWALTYILAGIGASSELGQQLIFKGGTALRKCLAPDWRYSVDLDFSAQQRHGCGDLLAHLEAAVPAMTEAAAEYGQLTVDVEHVEHRDPHPGGQCQFTLRVTIPGGSRTQAKLEISADEPVLLRHTSQPVRHVYPPEPEAVGQIRCYSPDELASEKLRAYLQSRQHLDGRGWVAGRSRDTFDLALLHREKMISPAAVAGILSSKCAVRNIEFAGIEDFRDSRVRERHIQDWKRSLLPTLPRDYGLTCESAFELLDDLLAAIFRNRP